MHVALAPLTVGRPEPLELVAAAAAAGFRRIGMTVWVPGADLSPLCHDRTLLRKTLSLLDASGVAPLDVGVVVLTPDLRLTRVRTVVDVAGKLGADRLIVMNQDADAHRAAASLHAVCEVARQADLKVGVEFMPYVATGTLQAATSLVAATGAANAGVVLDVLHLYRSGGTAREVAQVDGGLLHLVQLCDARRMAPASCGLRAEALGDRRYPGQGDLPLREVLSVLPPHVPMTVEAPVAADAHRPAAERAMLAAAAITSMLGAGRTGT